MQKDTGTEQLILRNAEQIFYLRGFDGARMQEIADRSGINKALVHYYYRSKARLFDAVFVAALQRLLPPLVGVLNSEMALEKKIDAFVEAYFSMVSSHPFMPGFVIQEMHRNPAVFRKFAGESGLLDLGKLNRQLEAGVAEGRYRNIAVEQFVINLLAFCAFPFIARQAIQAFGAFDDKRFEQILDERRSSIPGWMAEMLGPGALPEKRQTSRGAEQP
ncbi:MAG: TetR/AcrR family transcriptional regulator [Chlorobiaceae bacterium]|nr:TetR/AcrR family transcriptional regulator [Chlorobiaceae bacterium]NTW74435.1 TetR/AcrR family transcriptional regulator [Chlorobiaceae bacterium]